MARKCLLSRFLAWPCTQAEAALSSADTWSCEKDRMQKKTREAEQKCRLREVEDGLTSYHTGSIPTTPLYIFINEKQKSVIC